ncbi:MAG: TonB family protein [Candidatus Riflebacteria bacterium]|nr:TonB family protein [Candidatus Riflebacteria bacterium]
MKRIEAVAAKLKVAGKKLKIAGNKLIVASKELNEFQLSLILHLILFLLFALMPPMKVSVPKKTIKTMVPITLTEPRKRPVAGTSDRKKEGNSIQKPAKPVKKAAKAPVKKAPAKKAVAKTTPNKTTPSKPEVKKVAEKPAQTKAAAKPVEKAESTKVEQAALKPPVAPKVEKPAEAPKPAKNTTPLQKQETKPAKTPKAVQKQETKVAENVQPTPPLQTAKALETSDIAELPIQPNPARELTRPLVAALPSMPSTHSPALQAPSFTETMDFSFQPAMPEFQAPSSTKGSASNSAIPFLMEATPIESDSLLNSYFAETHDAPLAPKSGDAISSDGVNVSFIENIGGDPIDSNVTLPGIITQIKPDFPEWARKEGVSGEASFKVLIRKSGMVGDVLTLSSTIHPKLALDCSKTLRRWMFSPMIKDGQPQDTWVKITVKYSLE